MPTIRQHTIHVPGLDALGDFVEAILRWPLLRRLTRLRKRLSHYRTYTRS